MCAQKSVVGVAFWMARISLTTFQVPMQHEVQDFSVSTTVITSQSEFGY